jgi:peptidoglycan/xylan/chitin deacetylase (PgdA/CDA1 family)
MYHRVHRVGTVPDALRTHLRYLIDHHPLVLPGDPLASGELSVCLSFDDATVDFHREVYPLLQELGGRALVAVPTAYIETHSRVPMAQRLEAQQRMQMGSGYDAEGGPLCSWAELRLMQDSGLVHCAAHGHTHVDMTAPETDAEAELTKSHRAMESHLDRPPDTFVYPYGRASRSVQKRVRRHYRYAMRIGSALNRGWDQSDGLLYRVDAEHFWPAGKIWSFSDAVKYRLKYLGNRLRGK